MSALGTVIVELQADIAKYQTSLEKASNIAEQRMRQIDKSIGLVKTSLGVLGAGFLANATFDKIKEKIEGAISAAAGLKELSERTGSSIESLSGLAAIAKLTGTDTDALATGLQKLAKSMVDAENGGKKTSAAFEAIGISTTDLKGKNPDEMFQMLAKHLNEYQDGAEKTAIAQAILGKSGANLLPTLRNIADAGDLQVKVTRAQAEAAYQYEKSLARLQVASNAIYKQIAMELIPVFNEVVKSLVEVQSSSDGVKKTVGDLVKDGSIRTWAEDAALGMAVLVETFQVAAKTAYAVAGSFKVVGADIKFATAVARGNPADIAMAAFDRNEALSDANKRYSDMWNFDSRAIEKDLRKRFAALNSGNSETPEKPRKRIDASGLGNDNLDHDDPAKKVFEGKLKAQEDFIASEGKLLAQRESAIQYYAELEYMTRAEAIGLQRKAVEESLSVTQAAFDKEIAIAQQRAKDADKEVDRQDALNKVAELRRKKAEAEAEANNKIGKSELDLMAIQRRFDIATTEGARQAKMRDDEARFQIGLIGKSTLEVKKLNAERQIELALEERIYQIHKQDANADVSGAIAQAAVDKANATARITEEYNAQREAITGVRNTLQKYVEDSTNDAEQIGSALCDAFRSAEDALVSFVTTGKLNFSNFVTSILADLARIEARKAVSSIAAYFFDSIGPGTIGDLSGARANGGPVSGGSSYLVGERGPEIFTPSGSGAIIPNHMLGGGGGITINIETNVSDNGTSSTASGDAGSARAAADALNARIRSVVVQETRPGGALWNFQNKGVAA